ncbi:nuclease-related domain-containing protein [Desulfobacula sp.]|uniref:nuclease-related domain-containing protein n=1 Tax=Desulfobacula sp. TaxID=2593537 RepID=UPI00262483C6|nr:nuclease-related domain-containing protein [Desulfobacula sp.]
MSLKEMIFSLMPAWIFLFSCFVPVLLIFYIFKHQTRKKKSPLTIDLLRSPGESLRIQIDKSTNDILENFFFLCIFPIILYSVSITQYSFSHWKPGITYFILMGLIITGGLLYFGKKLYKLFKQRNHLRIGYECEVAIGQSLQKLAKYGFNTFHDFPAQKNFNIDHIAVGPQGIFAVETKGRAKLKKAENNNWKLLFDGERLRFPGWTETEPVSQTTRQAKWLQNWIKQATGDQHYVTPVLAIPGWFIDFPPKPSELKICNGKSFDFLTKNRAVLTEKQIAVISFQIEKMCRNIECKSYNKK